MNTMESELVVDTETDSAARFVPMDGGAAFDIGSGIVIGRNPDCDVTLSEPGVSRVHAEIVIANDVATLIDKSSYGTQVNGALINKSEVTLNNGDIIVFDSAQYRFENGTEEPAAPPPRPEEQATMIVSHKMPPAAEVAPAAEPEAPAKRQRMTAPARSDGTVLMAPGALAANSDIDSLQPLDPSGFDQPTLVVRSGAQNLQQFVLDTSATSWTIGSNPNCALQLTDPSVSDQHAVIEEKGSTWQIDDCIATNIVRINGEKRNRSLLSSGDIISFGGVHCEFILPAGGAKRSRKRPNRNSQTQAGNNGGSNTVWIILAAVIGSLLLAGGAFYVWLNYFSGAGN